MIEFNKKTLKNGLTVLHEKRDVPVTTVMLATKFGSLYEQEKEKGIAHFIEHLCFKGTKKRSAREIAFEVEKVGGSLNAFTEEEETAFHVKLPSCHLEKAMEVIFDIFFNPIFPEQEIEKERGVILEEIKMYKDNPAGHVINKVKECLYESPFGMFIAGNEETVKSITRDQIIAKHKQVYCPRNSILCVVGNNDFEKVLELAEGLSPKTVFIALSIPKIKKMVKKDKESRDNLEQANLAIGLHLPFTTDREKISSLVFSTILGGGMSSKLFTEVREKRGLAYAIKAFVDKGKNYSHLIIYIGTEKDKTEEVIGICLEEFKKLGEISKKELEDAKEQVIGNYEVDSEASESNALHLILEEIQSRAEDYYKFKENVKEVSLEDIKKISEISEYAYFVLS